MAEFNSSYQQARRSVVCVWEANLAAQIGAPPQSFIFIREVDKACCRHPGISYTTKRRGGFNHAVDKAMFVLGSGALSGYGCETAARLLRRQR